MISLLLRLCFGNVVNAAYADTVRTPLRVTLRAPITLVFGAVLQWDSAVAHWNGRARWNGRPVARRVVSGS